MAVQLRLKSVFKPAVSAGPDSFACSPKSSAESAVRTLRDKQSVSVGVGSPLWSGWPEVGGWLEVWRS
jgi:hypothetical protein